MTQDSILGQLFIDLSKDYVAHVTDRLLHLDIERHYYALYILDKADTTLTQSELAESLQVDKVAVVRLVDYLTEAGYVKRRVDLQDRRKQHVVLLPKSQEILPEIREAFADADNTLLTILDDRDRQEFLRIVSKLREFYDENPKSHIKVNMNYKRVKG